MGYENKIPNIGKTVQSVRDTDFISITEVKAFDKLIDDIVSKLSVISNDNSSITDVNKTLNIAQEIKKIEFNMADAINPDGSLNISSTPDPVTGEVGGPVYGEYSMDKMLIKLDNLYNRFTKLVGEHGTEWKIDLDNYYNSVYNDFKNTVNSIFGNSVNNEAIEGKENTKYDYTKRSAVKLESNEIMRLNPDVAAYPRTVNVLLSKPNTDTIAFEVTELESKNFVMNMRFFNGSNYFSYNVIIDNDELFITKEESFKYNNFTYTIKIFKYEIDNSNKYIVTLSSDCNDITVKYSFRIEGLLVGTYDFSTSGFNLSDHKNRWNYEIVDKNVLTVPEYNVDYWYKEEIPVSDISETSSNSFNWKSVTGLRSWDDKEYYIRKENFTEIGKIEINSDKDTGTVNLDNKDISGKDVTNESYPTIVNKKKYTKPLYYTHVDMDTSEIFENNGSRENFIKNNDFYHLDEGAKFIHTSGRYTYEKRDGKRNIDGNLILASGNNIISLGKIKPKTYIEFNDNKDNSITNEMFFSLDDVSLYLDFTNNSDGHLSEAALKNTYGENNVIVPVILDFVDFFINKLTISSNGCHLYNENLQEVIQNTTELIIDGISLFVDINGIVYVMPKYNRIIYNSNSELIKDISILTQTVVDSNHTYYKGITNDLIPLNYKLINFNNSPEIDADDALVLNKYRLVVESEYSKLLDLETESKGIKDLILKYDEINKVFVRDPELSDLFIKTPYIDCISNVDIKNCVEDDKYLMEFVVTVDNNREQDAYKFIYNNSETEIEFPNIMNRKDFVSSKEIPMEFISTASDEHLIYSISGDKKLYYSIDGSSWKEESRVNYNKFRDFSYIEYDKQSLWFALCYSVETGRNELVYSQNGYDWNLVERGSVIGSDENILKFKNVAINRYFLGTDKYAYFSEDGINWIKTNIPTGEWRDCAWNTKKFIVVGSDGAYQVLDGMDINTIANGFTFCTGSSGNWSNVATYDDYYFVICGSSGAMYSNIELHTWQRSDIQTGNFYCLTTIGSTVIAGSGSNGLYYSEDNGKTWNQSNIKSNGFFCLTVIGSTVIASSWSDKGLYYSEDNGKTWNQSNIQTGNFRCLTVIGSTVIAGSYSDNGLYYSEDNGKTWNQSNIQTGTIECLTTIGSTVIAGSYSNSGLYYSEDNGHTWQRSNIQSGSFLSLTVIGSTVIAGGWSDKGLYYSEDNGHTWQRSNIQSSNFKCLTVIGSTVIAGGWANNGLYYSEDNGHTWQRSDIQSGEFWCLTVIGSTVIAGGDSNNGLYYSEDNGKTWNQSNIQTGNFYCLTTVGSTVIAGSNNNGLYYSDNHNIFTRNSDIGFIGTNGKLTNGKLINGKIFVGNYSKDNIGGFIDKHNIFQFGSNNVEMGRVEGVGYSSKLKLYVASTHGKGLWYSYDGRYWIQSNITSGISNDAYWDAALKLFISGADSKILYSTDGKTWTDSNITNASYIRGIYKIGETICIGTNASGDYYSSDGKNWTRGNITTSSTQVNGFVSDDISIVVAIGDKGLYYTTGTFDAWVKCDAVGDIRFDSLIYDPTYKKFYASGNGLADIYISSDGINWTTVTTSGPKGRIASNGKIILAFPGNDNPSAQGEYSIDGGQTWSTIKGLPSNISTWWITYNKFSDTWYSCYNSGPNGIVYSRNGIDWNLLFEPTPTSFTGETKLISTHAEDDTSEDILGYFFIINGKDIHRSRDGHYWQKISYDSNITSLSAVGNVTNRDAFLCLENKGILVSTRNKEALNGKFSTYGEYFEPTSITEGTYGDIVQTTNSDTNNTAYIAQSSNSDTPSIRINESKNSYLPITFKTGDKISFIGDIGDNELIAADNVEYLNYDRYDRAFTPNVTVGNRNINFIKRITDKTTILGLDTSLVFTDESNNDVYTKSDISVSDIVVTTNGIYGLNNSTGMFAITNPDSNSPTFTEVFSDLSTYNIRNIFEYSNRDLLFIAYKDSKYTIFRKKYSETTIESLSEFTGSIQFIDLIDDQLIMLAHGLNNGTEVNYVQNIFFDNKTNSIVTQELIDAEKILNFDKVIKYKGELFVFNKLEENENIISMNFGKLILNGDGTLVLKNSDNGIITYQKNQFTDRNYPAWNGFVYNDKLYFYNYHGELLPTEEDPNAEPIKTLFKGLYTIEDTETANGWNIIPVDNLLSKTLDLLFTDELIVQDSLDNSLIIHDENDDNYKLDFDSDSKLYKNDKIYFDKETKGLVLGKYHSNGIFNLYTEMLTAVKSETGDNINIALALGQDAKVALYDKDYDFLKVLDFRYVADRNGSGVPYYLNISDSEEAVITNIYSGTKASENWLYFVVKDKFSNVLHDDYGNFSVSSSSSVSLRLFKVSISSIKTELNSNSEKITCEWISDIIGLDNIDNINIAFSRDGIIKTDPLTIENYNGLQYIISGKNLRYPNVDSIASFNVNTDCLIITSKIIWDSKFIDIIDQTEDINNELNYTKAVICSYDYNKAGKLDDNRAVSSFLLLNTETNGTIEHAYVTGKPNNTPINIGKRVFNTCKSGFKYTTTAKNTDVSTRYPNSYVGSDSTGLESSFVPSKIVKTDVGGLVLDTVSTSGINNGGYLVNKYNESITLDKFSDGNKFYYNDAKNTEIGLFRWFNSSVNSYKPSEFANNSDAKNTGWLYFTPKNSGKIVRFDLGPNDYVYNVYETYAGVFISVRETMRYGTSEINNFELYRLINIPNTTEIVQMGDTRYFQKCNCGNDPVIDLRDASEGIFMIAFYSTRTRVFRWNGEDFYMIKMDLNYTTGIKRIYDTSVGVFFMGNKAEWGLLKYIPSLDKLVHTKYKVYLNNWMSTSNVDTIETERGIYVTGTKTGTTNNKVIWDLKIDKCKELGNIGDIGLPKEVNVYPYTEDEFFAYNNYFKKLSEKISDSYKLPMDTWVKTIGNIDINGIEVPIKGMKLVSGEGVGNNEPDNVIFSIDQNARFNGITSELIDLPKDGNISGTIV